MIRSHLWSNDASAASYTPDERYQFNTTGELNTVTRVNIGIYHLDLLCAYPRHAEESKHPRAKHVQSA